MKFDSSYDVEDFNIENPLKNFSFFKFLYQEVVTSNIEREGSIYKNRKKRIYTFLSIPINLESFLFYALLICADHFLWLYTFLPLKCILLPLKLLRRLFNLNKISMFHSEELDDLVKLSLIAIPSLLMSYLDTSMVYHQIRSQSVIKLYIFFNMLEIADRLLSTLSQDVMDALTWTIGKPDKQRSYFCAFIGQFIFAIFCFAIHILVLISQTTILSVAFNSHSTALITVMMSNNFVELKGNVFRKVEKTNLFQMACADSRERFHYVIMLSLIGFLNLTENGWNSDDITSLVTLSLSVLLTEVLVDWIKHAFVTKFNFISADVYRLFSVSLAYDLLLCKSGKNSSSYFELMSRRIGLTSIPLACLVNLFLLRSFRTWFERRWLVLIVISCLIIKISISVFLLSQSYRKVNSYMNAESSMQQVTTSSDPEKESLNSKVNEFDIVLPPLTKNMYCPLKRTLSYSEGLRTSTENITDENKSKNLNARLARSSLILLETSTKLLDIRDVNDTSLIEQCPSKNDIDKIRTLSSKTKIFEAEDDTITAVRQRCRTISSFTEDLSDTGTEPLIIQYEQASGVTSDINDGSMYMLMDNSESVDSDTHESEQRQPFAEVNRFAMYSNQIV